LILKCVSTSVSVPESLPSKLWKVLSIIQVIQKHVTIIIGTHIRPTPIINLTYQEPTCHDSTLPDRHKSHIPKRTTIHITIDHRSYTSLHWGLTRAMIRDEITTAQYLARSPHTLVKEFFFLFPYLFLNQNKKSDAYFVT